MAMRMFSSVVLLDFADADEIYPRIGHVKWYVKIWQADKNSNACNEVVTAS